MSPVGHFRTPDEWQALKWLTDSLRPKRQSLLPPAIPAKLKGQTTLKAVIRNATASLFRYLEPLENQFGVHQFP